MKQQKSAEEVYHGEPHHEDEFVGKFTIENIGSRALRERGIQSVVATDRNYLLKHKKNSKSYHGEIPDPFDREKAETLFTAMHETYQDNRQLTPFEILAQKEEDEAQLAIDGNR